MPRSLLWSFIQPRWKGWVLPGMVAMLMLYTADQLFTGDRGMVTWRIMRAQIADIQGDITQLKTDNARLEGHINRLKGMPLANGKLGKPDKDFVDELLRRDLGLLKEGELVILLPKTPGSI